MEQQIQALIDLSKAENNTNLTIILNTVIGSIQSEQEETLALYLQELVSEVLLPNAEIMREQELTKLN